VNCYPTFIPFAEDWLLAIRQVSPMWFNDAMVLVSTLCNESGYIFLVLCGLSLGLPRMRHMLYLFLFSAVLNTFLKGWVAECRPLVPHLMSADGFSFPSGHAQAAATFWGFWAFVGRKSHLWLWAIFVTVLVGFSRNVVGVHYVHDVIVGAILGLLLAWVFYRKGTMSRILFSSESLPSQLLWAVLWAGGFWVVQDAGNHDFIRAWSAFVGLILALEVTRSWRPHPKSLAARTQFFILSWCAVFVGIVLLKKVFLSFGLTHPAFAGVRYGVGVFGALVLPAGFFHFRAR
jgi:membrane-associated phospholipid phosphatase